MTIAVQYLDRFIANVRARLEAGAIQYGNRSFRRPLPELLIEIQEELEDVCGWSAILWVRLEQLREAVENAERRAR